MKKSILLLATLGLLSSHVLAAPPQPPQITPISWILQTQHNGDVDGKLVRLEGRVIKPDNGSDWWFADTTGSVRLDAGDKELPVGPMLIVTGHIDQAKLGIGYLEVEVKHWQYANRTK